MTNNYIIIFKKIIYLSEWVNLSEWMVIRIKMTLKKFIRIKMEKSYKLIRKVCYQTIYFF
jgi:hypothetical protein